jgi:L-seryl-tRNA(Ser) seleniumtransferase
MEALPGAGSAPGITMPSYGVEIAGDHLAALRDHETPVIARSRDDRTLLDLRSVAPDDDAILIDALRSAAS